MKVLLHMCCAPCTITPFESLTQEGMTVMGFFYRHNIHPFSECLRREEALKAYAADRQFRMIWQSGYEMETFLRSMVFRENQRCGICYHQRLTAAAKVAKKGKFDAFSSTLLYSRQQNHEQIRATGESVAREVGVPFLYRDFRDGWKKGIETSKALGMYRQQYCGCIYSEKDRYYNERRHGPGPKTEDRRA